MLHLAAATDPRWSLQAREHIDEILLDHAHCEKKAASTAISLIFRYPERAPLMVPLAIISPILTLQPFTVWCANCCSMVQYMYL